MVPNFCSIKFSLICTNSKKNAENAYCSSQLSSPAAKGIDNFNNMVIFNSTGIGGKLYGFWKIFVLKINLGKGFSCIYHKCIQIAM